MKIFYIEEFLGSDLMSRPLAGDFYEYVRGTGEKDVVIDFSGVNFATRSFMDEFYNLFLKLENKEFNPSVQNMTSDIEAVLKAVMSTQNQKKEISDARVEVAKDLEDVERFFAANSI